MGLPPANARAGFTQRLGGAAPRPGHWSQERAREGKRVLTTAVGLQRDDTGQRELHEGRYHAGVESPGLPQQALRCIREHEATDVLLWKDLEGVFTSGLMTEQGATDTVRGHTAQQGYARPQGHSLLCSYSLLPLGHLPSSTGSRLSFRSAWGSLPQESSLTL